MAYMAFLNFELEKDSAIKSTNKPEEAKNRINTIIVQSAERVTGGKEMLGIK